MPPNREESPDARRYQNEWYRVPRDDQDAGDRGGRPRDDRDLALVKALVFASITIYLLLLTSVYATQIAHSSRSAH